MCVISLAALFCTNCSLCMRGPGIPQRTALKLSSFDVTCELMRISAASLVKFKIKDLKTML